MKTTPLSMPIDEACSSVSTDSKGSFYVAWESVMLPWRGRLARALLGAVVGVSLMALSVLLASAVLYLGWGGRESAWLAWLSRRHGVEWSGLIWLAGTSGALVLLWRCRIRRRATTLVLLILLINAACLIAWGIFLLGS